MFGVIVKRKVHIPTQGHGYPAYDMEYEEFVQLSEEHNVMAWVKNNDASNNPKKYKLVKFEPLSIDKTVSYKIH